MIFERTPTIFLVYLLFYLLQDSHMSICCCTGAKASCKDQHLGVPEGAVASAAHVTSDPRGPWKDDGSKLRPKYANTRYVGFLY